MSQVLLQIFSFLPLLALAVAAFSLWQTWLLRRRFTDTLGGTEHQDLKEALASYYQRVRQTDTKLDELTKIHQQLVTSAGLASQKISVVRFNPFGDTGGDQSFALAVLDAHHSGYVLTSMHGREGTRVYIKPIDLGQSKYTLSKEERQAIEQATKRVPAGGKS